ncbi:hypothetical protein VNI00_015541 [Paramarasmius palmivorus]|uniref:Uncharacterized protein n=1 Tax=Paramarasmius palmivorus TaxID=297713 RepID=A0AAW0BJJ2_9AGAR
MASIDKDTEYVVAQSYRALRLPSHFLKPTNSSYGGPPCAQPRILRTKTPEEEEDQDDEGMDTLLNYATVPEVEFVRHLWRASETEEAIEITKTSIRIAKLIPNNSLKQQRRLATMPVPNNSNKERKRLASTGLPATTAAPTPPPVATSTTAASSFTIPTLATHMVEKRRRSASAGCTDSPNRKKARTRQDKSSISNI